MGFNIGISFVHKVTSAIVTIILNAIFASYLQQGCHRKMGD
jgi:hypothetical protein